MTTPIDSILDAAKCIPVIAQKANILAFRAAQFFAPQASASPHRKEEVHHTFVAPPKNQPWSPYFKVRAHQELIHDSFNADFEYLVKKKINTDLPIGTEVTIRTNEGPIKYSVYRKIAGEGLVSYALKPVDANHPPLVVFRCTEPNPFREESFSSIQNDIRKNIGEKGWNAQEKAFDALMNDPDFKNPDQKVIVGGYSLGGAQAQYFVAKHHQAVSRAIFYSNPSIDPKIADQFVKDIGKTQRDTPLILQVFRTIGDPVHHFGEKHLGCGVDHPNVQVQLLEIDVPGQQKFDPELHSKRYFKTKTFDYIVRETTNPEVLIYRLDNSKRDPVTACAETIRQRSEGFLSTILNWAQSAWDCLNTI